MFNTQIQMPGTLTQLTERFANVTGPSMTVRHKMISSLLILCHWQHSSCGHRWK